MSKTRRKYSADFKLKVVLDMLKGAETISEIAHKYGVHQNQILKAKNIWFFYGNCFISGFMLQRQMKVIEKSEFHIIIVSGIE